MIRTDLRLFGWIAPGVGLDVDVGPAAAAAVDDGAVDVEVDKEAGVAVLAEVVPHEVAGFAGHGDGCGVVPGDLPVGRAPPSREAKIVEAEPVVVDGRRETVACWLA